MCDEAIIYHVEEHILSRVDQRTFACWALSKDPSRIPQVVYLSLIKNELDPSRNVQVHFLRPGGGGGG
jgi:hypothetical protein